MKFETPAVAIEKIGVADHAEHVDHSRIHHQAVSPRHRSKLTFMVLQNQK